MTNHQGLSWNKIMSKEHYYCFECIWYLNCPSLFRQVNEKGEKIIGDCDKFEQDEEQSAAVSQAVITK